MCTCAANNAVHVFVVRYTATQHLAEKAKILRKEAKGVQNMVMKDEVRLRDLEEEVAGLECEYNVAGGNRNMAMFAEE